MGCLGIKTGLDPEIEKILEDVAKKSPDIIKPFIIKKEEIDKKKKELLEEREKKVSEAKDAKEEDLEKLLKEYNKKEVEIEKELIGNEVEKMYALWELGIDLAQPLKNFTIDKLTKKLDKTPDPLKPALNKQIAEVKAYTPHQFLNSTFGKPLKTALIKQGMSKDLLVDFKKDLLKDRKNRRKEERNKFKNVKKNEFPPEDELEFDIDDLYDAIFEEYKDDKDFKVALLKKLKK